MIRNILKSSDGRDNYPLRNWHPASLPDETTAKERAKFIRAAQRAEMNLNLDDDGHHATARALTTLTEATEQIRTVRFSTQRAGATTIKTIDGQVYLGEILPLFQPRGAALSEADELQARGSLYIHDARQVHLGVASAEIPLAMTTLTFRDEAHLRSHVSGVIQRTRALGRDYSVSILTKKVASPVLLEAVRVEFEDETETFTAMAVRDGVSRVISAWKVLLPNMGAAESEGHIMDAVLGSRGSGKGATAASRIKGRAEYRAQTRADAARGKVGAENDVAVRVGQAFTVPARIIAGDPIFDEDFEESVREAVAVSNGESRPWSKEMRDGDAIERALRRSVHDGHMDAGLQRLATGMLDEATRAKIFGLLPPNSKTYPLWRGVYLLSRAMDSKSVHLLKTRLSEVTGRGHISDADYARFLMQIIEAPWRNRKGLAAAAWADGGPIPLGVEWDTWTPVLTDDFTELVPRALAGDVDARVTLQVAGGIALAADRLLVGKSLEDAPFAADVPTILDGLGSSAAGLWLLARAANTFDTSKMAWNALPTFKKSSLQAVDTYIVPKPNFQEPELLLDANAGPAHHREHPVPLTASDVVAFSDPRRASIELDAPGAEASEPSVGEVRDGVLANLVGALSGMGDLHELLDDGGLQVPPLLGDDWDRVHGIVSELQALVWRARPQQ